MEERSRSLICEVMDDNTSSEPDCDSALIATQPKDHGDLAMDCIINKDTASELICLGYKRSLWKSALSLLGVICTGGFLLLIFYWRPDWKLLCTHSKTTLKTSRMVLLKTTDETNQVFVSSVQQMATELAYLLKQRYPPKQFILNNGVYETEQSSPTYGTREMEYTVMFFKHHSSKFIWDVKLATFVELGGLDNRATLGQIHQDSTNGLIQQDHDVLCQLYGLNLITVKIPSYFKLLMSEILNPFYVFQLFAVIFWMTDDYYVYATAIFIISIISAVTSLIEVRRERVRLHKMVEYHNETKVNVLRQNDEGSYQSEVWSKDLVPGDVIVIPPAGQQLSCDAALVSGTCIVNESMLTGESVPVTKTPLPSSESEMNDLYDIDAHKRHTLFCGTHVLQTRFYRGELVKAVVVRTGYHTAKGRLVHSILYPKPVDMKLLRDAYRFITILFLIAMSGFVYTVVIQDMAGESAEDIAFNAIDLITISVPPALPLAMTIGIIYAQLRLKKQKIHCISPQRINISGQVDVVAFDKTGTLTEDGLDLSVVVPANHKPPTLASDSPKFMLPIEPENLQTDLGLENEVMQCMVTCHTLTIIDGTLAGDPLDLKMFEATGWRLMEPSVEDESKYDQLQTTYLRPSPSLLNKQTTIANSINVYTNQEQDVATETSSFDIGIVRQFPFSSSLQRASVIVKPYQSKRNEMIVYMKGAPETVAKLCKPETLPADFHDVLKGYTQEGYRMIGMAYKPLTTSWLKAQKIERKLVECEMVFLGLIALQNKLKPQSAGALAKLRNADIRSLMVTGDNILTSLSVARESGLIQPNDTVLLAKTTPPTDTSPATLTWEATEDSKSGRTSNRSSTTSPFSSMEEKICKPGSPVTICMSDQVHQWHLAVSGHDYEIMQDCFSEWMEVLAVKGTVFARMSPSQKTSLMEELQSVGYHVCMCGDGANDCGALKRAHAGLSLSEYEASVAAPFTSHTDLGIECVPTLIREGRAALVTSFGMFKFMALYSIIQFCSVTLLYNDISNLGDLQYLYIDLIVIDLVAVTMSRNHAHKTLHKKHPPSSLVSVEMLVSLIGQIILQLVAQLAIFFLVKDQCWYTNLSPTEAKNSTVGNVSTCPQLENIPDQSGVVDEFNVLTYEDSCIFLLSSFLYLNVSVAFSRGKPFRTNIYKNKLFVASLLLLTVFTLFLVFFSPLDLKNFIMLRHVPDTAFLGVLVGIAAAHLVVSVAFEMLVIEPSSLWDLLRNLPCYHSNHISKRYKVLIKYFRYDCDLGGGFNPVISSGLKPPNPLLLVGKAVSSNVKTESFLSTKTRL